MSVWSELQHRNVMRVAALYIVSAWLILQVVDVVAPILVLPDWFARGVLLILALGFVPTLVFSWVYEITPEGIRRESTVERSESITAATARKLDLAVIALLLLAMGMFALDRFATTAPDPASVEGASEEALPSAPAPAKPALDAATQESIAVLPFTDLSPTGDQAYFADGIAEELLNTLVRIPDLQVAARTSSFRFRESDRDIADIAKQLGVATVLEGSVRRSGDNIRITAQLIDAETGFHLWSESYDESVSDVFEIQNRIARQIATALKVQLEAQAAASRPANQAAFQALLEGRYLFAERHWGNNRYDGIAQFALATELDPAYADAWAYYAYSLSVSGPEEMGLTFEEKHRRIDAAADRALAL
ncbi:MAG: hypothetical protein R3191_05555, partial [Anaerolineales bacterium]|nr:hypothetical protein [Anaerolineales bacterium]